MTTTPRTERAQELADLVRRAGEGLDEAVKWGRLTFTAGGDWHHWVCAVAESANAVGLVFHKGALLDDPAGLLTGDAKYIRIVPYGCAVADPEAVIALVRSAIAHQTDMLPG